MEGTTTSSGAEPEGLEPTHHAPHRAALVPVLAVGVAANVLVRSPQDPGLNVPLFFLTLSVAIWATCRRAGHRPSPEAWACLVGGTLMATGLMLRASPVLQVLAFLAAVFAELVTDLFGTAFEKSASHVVVTAILAWLAAGYLAGFLGGTRVRDVVEGQIARPSVGVVEIGVALGLVALLFAAFVAVQFRYLFGGAEVVEVTAGLTYAEYTREGFGQLVLASALVLPTLLFADWLLRRPDRRQRVVLRALGGVQLLLLVLVIVSAFQRVRAYQEAYGLTESRFYGTVFLGWLTLLSVWFAVTVLRGRREPTLRRRGVPRIVERRCGPDAAARPAPPAARAPVPSLRAAAGALGARRGPGLAELEPGGRSRPPGGPGGGRRAPAGGRRGGGLPRADSLRPRPVRARISRRPATSRTKPGRM